MGNNYLIEASFTEIVLYISPHAWQVMDTYETENREYHLVGGNHGDPSYACPRNSEEKKAHSGLRSLQEAYVREGR